MPITYSLIQYGGVMLKPIMVGELYNLHFQGKPDIHIRLCNYDYISEKLYRIHVLRL